MKRWFIMVHMTMWGVIFCISDVQAAEVYCSLNDGKKADGKSTLEHQGAKHEFCCLGCLQQFKDNPRIFAEQRQQLNQMSTTYAEATCSSVCSDS